MGKDRLLDINYMNIENNKNFVFGLSEIKTVVDFLKQKCESGECKIFAFYGPLGAGKTTIIRELLKSYAVQEPITSPTFTYLNCYQSNKNNKTYKFYHFDLYRLKNLEEFSSSGFEEYLYDQEGISFVEWPEIIEPILQSGSCKVKIDYNSNAKKRSINVEIID